MIINMNGQSPPRKSYVQSLSLNGISLLEYFIIIGGGALAAFLHAKLRIPLNLPGHHGLEFMAIYVFIRLSSDIRYAATTATLGTGLILLIPGFGASSALHSITYLLPGLVLDALFIIFQGRRQLFLITVIIAGLAYMSIPLSRFFLQSFTVFTSMAFIKFGALYTLLSFMLFGMLGGMLGYGLHAIKSIYKQKN